MGRFWSGMPAGGLMTHHVRRLSACLVTSLLLFVQPAHARWLMAESTNFRIYSSSGERELRDVTQQLEDYDQLLRLVTKTTAPPSPNKLTIYLTRGLDQLRTAQNLPANALGAYEAQPGEIAAFATRIDQGGLAASEVLFHEYAHHFMLQYHPAAYPLWYVEGFAEFMMTARFRDRTIDLGTFNAGRIGALRRYPWIPVEQLMEGDLSKLSPSEINVFYAESWLFVHYLFKGPLKPDAVDQYLQSFAFGGDPKAAFEKTFGMTYGQFDDVLRAYLTRELAFSSLTRKSAEQPAVIKVTSLPSSADDFLIGDALVRLGLSPAKGEVIRDTIRAAAARYPNDRLAQGALSRIELLYGDRAAGTAKIDRLLKRFPTDAELLYLRGLSELLTGREKDNERVVRFAEAKRWFAQALNVDPSYVPALTCYAETYSLDPLSNDTLTLLQKARALAPQVMMVSYDASVALMRAGRFDEARAILMAMHANPHEETANVLVGSLILDAQDHRMPFNNYIWLYTTATNYHRAQAKR
jgi:tetratricopeptide (TPR) repeat protein